MSMANYSISFDCYESTHWNEYQCNFADTASYNEMINDIKYAARELGGGSVYIYDEDGECVETWTIAARPIAIYHVNDEVSFLLDGEERIGIIEIVDAFGTFFDNSEPYYDIYTNFQEKRVLVKHVRQSDIRGKAA